MAPIDKMSRDSISLILSMLVVSLIIASSSTLAQQSQDFKQVLANGQKLESVQQLLASSNRSDGDGNRRLILGEFLRVQKSDICRVRFQEATRVTDEYRPKAYSYVDDSRKSGNWFTNIVKFNNPLNALKWLSRNDKDLSELTERYEKQWKSRLLTRRDVDCDLLKYKIRVLDSIMFILRTDLKYLLLDSTDAANRAIYYQLKMNNLVSSNNFYEVRLLEDSQRLLLLDYVRRNLNENETNLGDLINRFADPGNLIIGRLQDTCQTALEFQSTWIESESNREEMCSNSTSDPKNGIFADHFKQDSYDELTKFCHSFLNPLKPIILASGDEGISPDL